MSRLTLSMALTFTTLILAFIATLTFGMIAAQETAEIKSVSSLSIDPAIVEAVLDKSKPTEQVINLSNLTNLPIPIKVTKQSFTPREQLEIPTEQISTYDASGWISLAEKDQNFILQPREIRPIRLSINQSESASPGGHYASLIFTPLLPEGLVSDQSVFVYTRVAALVFLVVKGDIKEELDLKDLAVNTFNQNSPVEINTVLANHGNIHLRPTGRVTITNELNKSEVYNLDLMPSIVLPNTTKKYPVQFTSDNKFGIFSAQVLVNYGSQSEMISSQKVYFYMIPLGQIALVAGAVVLAIVAFRFRRRLQKAWKILSKPSPKQSSTWQIKYKTKV